jgi:hypothetical protein
MVFCQFFSELVHCFGGGDEHRGKLSIKIKGRRSLFVVESVGIWGWFATFL